MTHQVPAATCLILRVLRQPAVVEALDTSHWELLIRQARRSDLLATLYAVLKEANLEAAIPKAAQRHFLAASMMARANATAIRWEARQIYKALAGIVDPPVLLKGAAYLVAEGPAAPGRIFQDIDILLPKEQLEKAERALFYGGWTTTHLDAYDQQYYRRWMHELPPLRHMRRSSVVDVHHTIMPETSYIKLDGHKLIEKAETIDLEDGFEVRVLPARDMVLHSATHLFQESEFNHGLRDLFDLDRMLRAFSQDSGFWDQLAQRAKELGLQQPLFYATRYVSRILGTPVPGLFTIALSHGKFPRWYLPMMDFLFMRVLTCDHHSCRKSFAGVAKWLLFIRSHYIKMPLWLLIPHLIRKALRREDNKQEDDKLN